MLDDSTTSNWWDDRISPAIAVGPGNIIHAVWKNQRNTDTEYGSIPNRSEIYYASSNTGWANLEIGNPTDHAEPWGLDWETAINITNIADDPAEVEEMQGMLEPQYRLSVSHQALAVSADGVVHITWSQKHAGEEDYRVSYTNSNMVSFN